MKVTQKFSLADWPQIPNFLPIALSYFRGEEDEPRSLLTLNGQWLGATSVIFEKANTAPIKTAIATSDIRDLGKDDTVFIGPPASQKGQVFKSRTGFRAATANVGLVDVGIAFWHTMFRRPDDKDMSIFETMLFMEFDAKGKPSLTDLSEEMIRDICKLYDRQGQAAVIRKLARDFPGSIYGNSAGGAGLGPNDFAHGTAMACAMFNGGGTNGTKREAVGTVSAVGLELPAAAVFDRSGDTLRPVASMAVAAIARWFNPKPPSGQKLQQSPVHIAMPYAYLGGPAPLDKDTTFPVHKALERALGNNVKLYLPTGNLRQERQHLRFGDMEKTEQTLTWQIPVEDPTPNTIELCWKPEKPDQKQPVFRLCPPFGDPAHLNLQPDEVVELADSGITVCAGHLRAEGKWCILRLSLAPTRALGTVGPARAGQWKLALKTEARIADVHAFILRDDPPFVASEARRTRQSRFVDVDYETETTITRPATRNPKQTVSPIKRDGTVSHLVLGVLKERKVVSASERSRSTLGGRPSHYAGFFAKSGKAAEVVAKEVGSELMPGITAMVNGAGAIGRVTGTSMAVALAVHDALLAEASANQGT